MAKKKQKEIIRRQRRTIDQQIADLQAKIVEIKAREAQRKAKADPALKHASAAVRSIDKALAESKDPKIKKGLTEARSSLEKILGGDKGVVVPTRARRSASEKEGMAEELLTYVRNNPGQRGDQIARELGTDVTSMRPVMKQLIADGKVETEGQRRGMKYVTV